jgi:O-antigen/teichoic acid export membrane protein
MGLGLPLLAAVFTIPMLIASLGDARFGLLTLIWAVVSYFGLFDLGLGRALTQQLAVLFAKKELQQIGALVGTAILIMTSLGMFAGLFMAACASWGVGLINAVPDNQEAIYAVYAMALAMPFIVLTSGFRGILEAHHAFGVINVIRLPMGLFTFIGPLVVVLCWEPRLEFIAIVLSAGRLLACAVHAYFAWRVLPKEARPLAWDYRLLKPLCVSGGWLTVSNIISPFMGYVDRFVIAGIVSVSAVAYYATPHELVTKLWILPGALTAVLFPTFAAQMSERDPQTWVLFRKAVYWLFMALLPITMLIAIFANELLSFWINSDFASQSAVMLQIFAFGILVNCLAHVPFTLIQGAGSARLTAIIHAGEFPFFLLVLWWLTNAFGVKGAAMAWLLRMLVDTIIMFWACAPLLGRSVKEMINLPVLLMGLITLIGFLGLLFESLFARLAWAFCGIAVTIVTLFFRKDNLKK